MAVRHGYGKIAGADALVFAYDTGDVVNSYKGKPATNHLKFINQQYTPVIETYFRLSNGSHEVNVPTLGTRTVKYVDIWNDYNNGSGRCCLSLFSFGTGITAVSPNTTYMYQIVYKTDTGYSHPNYMYRYEYGASGYIKEGGLHSTGRRTHLGDGWYHAWGSFTTDVNTTYLNTYLFHYEYATQNRVQVAQVMLTEGSEVIPPRQFIDFEQTRSATEGLLDLTGNSTIDVSNTTYDSDAISNLVLDGTDDSINLGSYLTGIDTSELTIELVFRTTIGTAGMVPLIGWHAGESQHGYICTGNFTGMWGNESISFYNEGSNTTPLSFAYTNGHGFYNDSVYHHAVFVLKTGEYKIFVDGEEKPVNSSFRNGSMSTTFPSNLFGYGSTPSVEIGAGSAGPTYGNLRVPVAKIYNRALTAAEIKNNFNNYKGRFNL